MTATTWIPKKPVEIGRVESTRYDDDPRCWYVWVLDDGTITLDAPRKANKYPRELTKDQAVKLATLLLVAAQTQEQQT